MFVVMFVTVVIATVIAVIVTPWHEVSIAVISETIIANDQPHSPVRMVPFPVVEMT